jgi:hypothetical protein
MPLPLGPPRIQFIDADGHPYVGGTVETLIPGTSTPKDTWQDPDKAAVNDQPVVLDAAGRAIILGSADYRLIVRDVDGNLIYDGWTSTGISTIACCRSPPRRRWRMRAPCWASTRRSRSRRIVRWLRKPTCRRRSTTSLPGTFSGSLQSQIDTERSERIAADANLQTQIDALGASALKVGSNVTDSSGHIRVNFPTPFPNSTTAVVTQLMNSDLSAVWLSVNYDASGFDIWSSIPLADDTVHPIPAASAGSPPGTE